MAFDQDGLCALQRILERGGFPRPGRNLGMEYQKSDRYGLSQRPDIILHIPADEENARVTENNVAVWALKRRDSSQHVREDFDKFDEMFETLNYLLGIFVNFDAQQHFGNLYDGRFPKRVRTVAAWLQRGKVITDWGLPDGTQQHAIYLTLTTSARREAIQVSERVRPRGCSKIRDATDPGGSEGSRNRSFV